MLLRAVDLYVWLNSILFSIFIYFPRNNIIKPFRLTTEVFLLNAELWVIEKNFLDQMEWSSPDNFLGVERVESDPADSKLITIF